MKCENCRVHAQTYVKENPIEDYFAIKDKSTGSELGCFKWSYIFHNSVNRRLKKKEISWDEALMLYTSGIMQKHCTNCDLGGKEVKKSDYTKNAKIISRFK